MAANLMSGTYDPGNYLFRLSKLVPERKECGMSIAVTKDFQKRWGEVRTRAIVVSQND